VVSGGRATAHPSRWQTAGIQLSKPAAIWLFVILAVTSAVVFFFANRERPHADFKEAHAPAKNEEKTVRKEVVPLAANDRTTEVAPPPRPSVVYYYPVTVGTKWVYQTRMFGEPDEERTLVVTAVEGSGIEKIVTVGRIGKDGQVSPWEKVRVNDQRVYRLKDQGVLDAEQQLIVEGPNRFDENTERLFPSLRADNPQLARIIAADRMRIGVQSWPLTSLKVPAGTFNAIREVRSGGGQANDLVVRYSEESWYARDVGLIKRTVGPTEIVLKSFTAGK
jgi:hypothetical protein